jgi:putative transposase
MFVAAAEHFLSDAVDDYGSHPVSTDGGSWYPSQECKFLKINHHPHSSFVYKNEKSIIERTLQQYIKDRLKL